MKEKKLNICQVSLAGNLPIIFRNIKNFKKFYLHSNFFIIVPNVDSLIFKEKLKLENVNIISEDSLISFDEFKKISNTYLKKNDYYNDIQNRLSWYYQQILKISFLVNFIKNTNQEIIIWDADTIIIDKIAFFKNGESIPYGNTSEYHRAYYKTNLKILGSQPEYFISSLSQFVAMTSNDCNNFYKLLNLIYKNNEATAKDLTHLIMKSISNVHNSYNGSMFSEFELIGHSNLINNFKKQKLISGIRDNLSGKLSDNQIHLLKILGFKYVAYEHTHKNVNSIGMLERNQSWLLLFKILVKKISNNIFRGIRHHIKFYYR